MYILNSTPQQYNKAPNRIQIYLNKHLKPNATKIHSVNSIHHKNPNTNNITMILMYILSIFDKPTIYFKNVMKIINIFIIPQKCDLSIGKSIQNIRYD